MTTSTRDWLLVVDMQPAFGHPASPWFVPDYEVCASNITRLIEVFDDRVLFTRFVPPADPAGSWRSYYDEHLFALDPENQALWDLDPRWSDHRSVPGHRFAKWREAAPLLPKEAQLVMCGVATDCCVLGTAIEANDDGRKVRLPADACAAATDALHNAALTILADRGGLLELSDTDQELALASSQKSS